jgi:hypothetical protein
MDAEAEFSNVAFEILDKNGIVSILKQMNPISVLSLCQTNTRFAEICRDQNVFRILIKAHYPDFTPPVRDPKTMYMTITSQRGTVYYLPILEDATETGFPGKYESKATIFKPEGPYFEFAILGTRIRKGQEVWLKCRLPGSLIASAYRTREDAIEEIPILYSENLEKYIKERTLEYKKDPSITRRNGEIIDLEEWLVENDYPYPLTSEGITEWVEKNGYLRGQCRMKEWGHVRLLNCVWFVIKVKLG